MRKTSLAFGTASAILALPARADVVWPALYLETRVFTWWTIGLGLVIEFFFVRRLFALAPGRAALATLVANAISAVLGILLIPLSGLIWELFPGTVLLLLFNWGTFNPVTWTASFLLASLVTTAIEVLVYKQVFKLVVHRWEFLWLGVANMLSVGVAFGSLLVFPVDP